ncbi:MAG: hypothetical protein BWY09_02052 [Candidatus Hydrogenedentes bacterium ADurb.Bin179]|nr:MAG: hypothetical protein BWY09_02052 [Candidatus Hydrogenedentes bacterium ADurb.Bin179]
MITIRFGGRVPTCPSRARAVPPAMNVDATLPPAAAKNVRLLTR